MSTLADATGAPAGVVGAAPRRGTSGAGSGSLAMRWYSTKAISCRCVVLEDDEVLLGEPCDGPALLVLHVDVLNDQPRGAPERWAAAARRRAGGAGAGAGGGACGCARGRCARSASASEEDGQESRIARQALASSHGSESEVHVGVGNLTHRRWCAVGSPNCGEPTVVLMLGVGDAVQDVASH